MLTISDVILDDEFQALLPPLTADELSGLRLRLEKDGYLAPFIVWKGHGLLVDGYHRYDIWQTFHADDLDRTPEIVEKHFPDREAVETWIIQNQLARRNLTPTVRVELALKLKPALQAQAKERMAAGGRGEGCQNSDTPSRVDEQIAEAAGVSRDTVRKVEAVLEHGDEQTVADLRAGNTSVHAAYQTVQEPRAPADPAAGSERFEREMVRQLDRLMEQLRSMAQRLQDEAREQFVADLRALLAELEG